MIKLKNLDVPDLVAHGNEAKILDKLDGEPISESTVTNVRTHPAIAIYYENFEVSLNTSKYICIVSEYCSVNKILKICLDILPK